MGIISIKLKEKKAKEIIDELSKHFGWRFTKILDGEATYMYNYFDEWGYEYCTYVFIRASKDNKKIIIYLNKNEFENFARLDFETIEMDVENLIKDYIEQIEPCIIEKDYFF